MTPTPSPSPANAVRSPIQIDPWKPTRKHTTREKKLNYVADFETTTLAQDCRVWGWGLVAVPDDWENISLENVEVGTTLDGFIETISQSNTTTYFHNLRFDGRFILDWLLKNGYRHNASDRGIAEAGTFKSLISDMGQFYSITVRWANGFMTEFRDSVKKLPMSVRRIAESFKYEVTKGDIDYEAPRDVGYIPSSVEWDYIRRDVLIVAKALGQSLQTGHGKMTVGSDALAEFKTVIGHKEFTRLFPVLSYEMDSEIRRAYRGGFTYADDRFKNRLNGEGMVFDVNSLYPSVMYYRPIPYGEPEYVSGYVEPTRSHPLTIFAVTFTAKLKPFHVPCIQIKGNMMFVETDYVSEITEPTTLMVTNVDWALMNDHYDIDVLSYDSGWRFRAANGIFDAYIDKYMLIKANSEGGIREIAKLFLNSLYGKFATRPDVTGKIPVLDGETVRLIGGKEERRDPVYTAAGVFITSYARDVTIRAAQANYNAFAYADTDSLHLITQSVPDNIRVHPSELGAWKHEYNFDAAYYIRAKAYLERDVNGKFHNAIAGLPTEISSLLRFEHLTPGLELHYHRTHGDTPAYLTETHTHPKNGVLVHGKLTPRSVPGGVILQDTPYEVKLSLAGTGVLADAA
jgi:hypothetical protein